jgi:large subunit ribosomal protein L21
MYAIIKTGGKQYRVAVGDIVNVELLDSKPGDEIEFREVLFANDGSKTQVGQPSIANFFVYGKVLGQVSGDKVTGLKYKPSHNECRKWGHRQKYLSIEITGIGKQQQKQQSQGG